MSNWLVGIDSGGTRTRVLALDLDKGEVRSQEGPGANWTADGAEACGSLLSSLVREVLPSAAEPAVLCFATAGYYPPDHASQAEAWLAADWPGVLAGTIPDMVAAWAGAHVGESGIVVIAGTGSIAYGRGAGGREARAGGWGPLFGDGGSAYGVGIEALRVVAAVVDDIAPETLLVERFLSRWPELGDEPRDWLRGVYRHKWGRAEIAALAQEVDAAAQAEDVLAVTLLVDAARELATLARAVERRLEEDQEDVSTPPLPFRGGLLPRQGGRTPQLRVHTAAGTYPIPLRPRTRGRGIGPFPVALLGGLGTGSELLRTTFQAALRSEGSALNLVPAQRSSVEGALLLGAEEWGGFDARMAALASIEDAVLASSEEEK